MESCNMKKRIKREKPNKKWTQEEINKIIIYLQGAPQLEAPTAQIFYKKLIERSGIDTTWELIRYKVGHLKASFKKANDWRKSTGAGLLETDAGTSSVEGKVLQMCPHYNELKQIFGEKNVNGDFGVVDNGDTTQMDDHSFDFIEESPLIIMLNSSNTKDVEENFSTSSPTDVVSLSNCVLSEAKTFAEKLRKHAPKSSVAHLAAFQAERTELHKLKLEWEKEKHEKEIALSERKLKLEEEKIKSEIEFKILQLEKEERLRKLEIEKNERVERCEIEMKHKYQSQK